MFLVASMDGHWVGCGGFKRLNSASACIKRMWVDEAWRGKGIGRHLLTLLENQAKDLGYSVVKLETNRLLHEAIQLYRSQGYQEVSPFVDTCGEIVGMLKLLGTKSRSAGQGYQTSPQQRAFCSLEELA